MCVSTKVHPLSSPGLTHSTLNSIHIHIRVKLSRPHGFVGVHVATNAFRRAGAQGRGQAVVSLLFIVTGGIRVFHLFLSLGPLHVMDTEQQAVVHNPHLHKELHKRGQRYNSGTKV